MVKPREKRVPIMLSEDEMHAIDDWRFANRVATRSEAIRKLCQMGILSGERTKAMNERIQDSKTHYKQLETLIFSMANKHEGDPDFDELRQALDKFMLHYLGISISNGLTQTRLDSISESTDIAETMKQTKPEG